VLSLAGEVKKKKVALSSDREGTISTSITEKERREKRPFRPTSSPNIKEYGTEKRGGRCPTLKRGAVLIWGKEWLPTP